MSKFITTTEISHNIEVIIKEAKSFVLLVTPYVDIHRRLKGLISKKLTESDALFVIICREAELKADERKWLKARPSIKIVNQKDLHAKCYMNEQMAILTSMNLYEYSQVNNIEFGVLVEKKDSEYEKIKAECLDLCPKILSKELRFTQLLCAAATMTREQLAKRLADV